MLGSDFVVVFLPPATTTSVPSPGDQMCGRDAFELVLSQINNGTVPVDSVGNATDGEGRRHLTSDTLLYGPESGPNHLLYASFHDVDSSNATYQNRSVDDVIGGLREDYVLNIHLADGAWTDYQQEVAPTYDYQLSRDIYLLAMDDAFYEPHNVPVFNMTIEFSCFVDNDFADYLLLNIFGYDVVLLNDLFHGFEGTGYVQNTKTKQLWYWTPADVRSYINPDFADLLSLKIAMVVWSVFAFFAIDTMSALTVTTCVSSGVIFLFPLVYSLQCCGLMRNGTQILSLSYPWLGLPIERLREQDKSTTSFIVAHVVKVLVVWVAFQACQEAWFTWFYRNSKPDGPAAGVFGLFMFWEYFSMIFIRSAPAIRFYPQMCFFSFMAYHIYIYSTFQGFASAALLPLYSLSVFFMIFVLQHLEIPALNAGLVSLEHPRQIYTELGWPAWTADIPPLWTLFHPPNAVYPPVTAAVEIDDLEEVDNQAL
jgi:hypothetical protein